MRTTTKPAVFAAAAVVAIVVLTPTAASATAAPVSGDRVVGFTASSSAQQAESAGYWTADRMAKAIPADFVLDAPPPSQPATKDTHRATGKPTAYPPAPGLEGPAGGLSGGISTQSVAVARPYTKPPARLNGKVYFSKYTAGGIYAGDFVCSGTSVNSPGLSLVWTAGHCVHGGPGYGAHHNWKFVPAFSSAFAGDTPYKTWYAKELWTLFGWANLGDLSYDVGAAIVWRVDGLRLTERIGGQGIRFNDNPFQIYAAYGYPAAAPFSGYDQYSCISPLMAVDDPGAGPNTNGIQCDMTPGSSGGGWLINMDANGWGYVDSVNSYKRSDPGIMYGPYHGATALSLWDFVKNKTA